MTTSSEPSVLPILSAANFMIGMGAFMVVGMLNPVAETLGLTPSRAGLLMVVYALAYALLSPLLVSLTGRIGRRRVLAAGLATFAVSNLIAAMATGETTILISRVIAAAGAGVVTPVSAAVAAGLSAPERQARALAAVFFGLTLAQVLGVPLGSYVAYTFGWRMAFWLVAALCVPVVALIWLRIPPGLSFRPVSLRDLGQTLGNFRHMLAVSFTTVFLGAIYVIYTYLAPLLSGTMSYDRNGITLALLAFGLGAVVGNLAGGRMSDRIGTTRTLLSLALIQALIMPFFSTLPVQDVLLMLLVFTWAAFGWSFMAAQQSRLIGLDPDRAPVLLALNAAAIYVGAAVGSAVGADALSRAGLTALGMTGGMGALLAAVVLGLSVWANARATASRSLE
ncbi:MAG: MFS transporter [Pseudomonadota bacterium]